jgi:hypothetical protein
MSEILHKVSAPGLSLGGKLPLLSADNGKGTVPPALQEKNHIFP